MVLQTLHPGAALRGRLAGAERPPGWLGCQRLLPARLPGQAPRRRRPQGRLKLVDLPFPGLAPALLLVGVERQDRALVAAVGVLGVVEVREEPEVLLLGQR